MLNILQFGAVDLHQAQAPFTADGVEYPKGSYVIKMQQPFGSFAKTMMENQVYPDLREYPGGPPQRPYDVVAHTLPLQMGVKVITVSRPFDASLTKLDEPIRAAAGTVDNGPVKAYILEHESNASIRALNRLMKEHVEVYWAAKPITVKGRTYAACAMIIHTI